MRYLILFGALVFPTALYAQSPTIEIFGRAGLVQLWDDEGNIGTGPSIGGGLGVRFPVGVGIEGLFERHTNDRNFSSGVSFNSEATTGSLRVAKYFGGGGAKFYAGGAIGTSRITTRGQFPGLPQSERQTTSTLVGGFAGVRIPMGPKAFARPEIEFSRAGEHLRIAGSFAIGFGL